MSLKGGLDSLELKVEGLLFSYGDWMSVEEMGKTLEGSSSNLIKKALEQIRKKFEEGFSFRLIEDDVKGFKFSLNEEFEPLVERLVSKVEIPPKTLKVLSMVAYEQPITKTRLSELLGRGVIKELDYLRRNKFVSYEKRGIGRYYKVTRKFYDYFQLEEKEFDDKIKQSVTTKIQEPTLENNSEKE